MPSALEMDVGVCQNLMSTFWPNALVAQAPDISYDPNADGYVCLSPMRTKMQKFCETFDPTCGQSGSVGCDVRSDMRMNLRSADGIPCISVATVMTGVF